MKQLIAADVGLVVHPKELEEICETSGMKEIGEKKMARHHPIIWTKPLPLSWLLLMTPMNFGLFWQLDFETLDRSPGQDKQPVSSSEKASADRRTCSLPRPRRRPKGQEDAIKATNDYQFKGSNRKHLRFPDNIMNFLLGIILKTLWLTVNGINEHERLVYNRTLNRYKTAIAQIYQSLSQLGFH